MRGCPCARPCGPARPRRGPAGLLLGWVVAVRLGEGLLDVRAQSEVAAYDLKGAGQPPPYARAAAGAVVRGARRAKSLAP